MDVTSLLNSSSAALQQRRDSVASSTTPSATAGTTAASTAVHTPSPDRTPSRRTSGSKSPNRNRTPWDAGGYSLPLSLDTKSIRTPSTARPVFYCESQSPIDGQSSPKSPKHKFSDSRSSLSSYASSNNSVSHSRISSLSTVSEFQPLTNLITEFTLNSRISAEKFENGMLRRYISSPARSPARSPPSSIHSITNEEHPSASAYRQRKYSGPYADDISPTEPAPPVRPGSPSDAVIIRRGQGPTRSPSYLHNRQPYSTPLSQSRAHKRAVSAPNFPALSTLRRISSDMSGIQPPVIPDVALDRMLPRGAAQAGPVYAAQSSSGPNGQNGNPPVLDSVYEAVYCPPREDTKKKQRRCSWRGGCNENAPSRKSISQFFGRNKICTRQIPYYLWDYLCRKHYQRARYHSGLPWLVTQCAMVHNVIVRCHAYGDKNKDEGKGPVLKDWTLANRKRENERVKKAKGKKRKFDEDDDEDEPIQDFDQTLLDTSINSGQSRPDWLKTKMAEKLTGYTTEEVIDIVRQLTEGIISGQLRGLPDIEILPNFEGEADDEEEKPPKGKGKGKGPKRQKRQRVDGSSSVPNANASYTGASSSSEEHAYLQHQIGQGPQHQVSQGLQHQFGQALPRTDYQFGASVTRNDSHFRAGVPGGPVTSLTSSAFNTGPSNHAGYGGHGNANGPYHARNPNDPSFHIGSPDGPSYHDGPPNPRGNEIAQGYDATRPAHQRAMSAYNNYANGHAQPSGLFNNSALDNSYGRYGTLPPPSAQPGLLPLPAQPGLSRYPAQPGLPPLSAQPGPNMSLAYRPAPGTTPGNRNDVFMTSAYDPLAGSPQAANTGGAFGGAAKHTRHQSTPAVRYFGAASADLFYDPNSDSFNMHSPFLTPGATQRPPVTRNANDTNGTNNASQDQDLASIGGLPGFQTTR